MPKGQYARSADWGSWLKLDHETFLARVLAKYGDEYTVTGRYSGCHVPVELRHNTCGNTWSTTAPYDFLKPSPNRCPSCSHPSRRKTHEQFVAEVVDRVGTEYVPLTEYTTSKTPVLMRHGVCGREFPVKPNLFLSAGTRCPSCQTSPSRGIRRIREFLTAHAIRFEEEKTLPGLVHEAQLRIDIFLTDHSVAIEFDGEQHFTAKRGEAEFVKTKTRDAVKLKYCLDNGIPILKIPYFRLRKIDGDLRSFLTTHGILTEQPPQ